MERSWRAARKFYRWSRATLLCSNKRMFICIYIYIHGQQFTNQNIRVSHVMFPYGIASRCWVSSFSAAAVALLLQCRGTSGYHLQKRIGTKKDHERRTPRPPYAGIWLPRSRPPRSCVSALIPGGGGCSRACGSRSQWRPAHTVASEARLCTWWQAWGARPTCGWGSRVQLRRSRRSRRKQSRFRGLGCGFGA